MTKVKICGLKRKEDIEFANILLPEYAGFVFAASPRQVSAEQAAKLRAELDLRVRTVGVFVKEDINFLRVRNIESFESTIDYECDYLLLDTYTKTAYGGSGQRFDLEILKNIKLQRPFFLAGGLDAKNVHEALEAKPYAVDVSGGVETDGSKDFEKMRAFIAAVKGSREKEDMAGMGDNIFRRH